MLCCLSRSRGIFLALAMLLAVGLFGCRPSSDRFAGNSDSDPTAAPGDANKGSDSVGFTKEPTEENGQKSPPSDTPNSADESSASEPKDKPVDGHQPKKVHTNRLAGETSPYLLMHAHNPVDWYPWGPEALKKAKDENKPIFLSVGYSSCYWCHVMERESFMDEEVAELLNKHFVCIKIDREERPDIDQIYMTALTQVMQRHGGWPLSMFLTPDAKPFYGLTYLPARDGDREGFSTGFLTLAGGVRDWWGKYEDDIRDTSEMVSDRTALVLRGRPGVEVLALEQETVAATLDDLHEDFDARWGGFGYTPGEPRRPKFPEPSNLFYLLDRLERGDVERMDDAQSMLLTTLDKMYQGGIYDHLGGGFHRYSTDRFWHIPHFEKMLYDNGQLASVYAQAYALTEHETYRRVVEGILSFVQREMTDEGGAFYAALDAETDAEEGKFYRWEKEEIEKLLDKDELELFAAVYGVGGEPNFEEHYALLLDKPLGESAEKLQISEGELIAKLTPIREKLFASRSQRPRPLTDTKILTADNGLMIRGFADAGRYLENPDYVAAAQKAAQFVLDRLRSDDGRLLRTYSQGEAKLNAYLDDYAFLVDGLIALHRATGERKWLDAADALTDKQLELFWDERHGGFFFTSNDHEELIARAKDPVDGALPAGNSVSAANLLYLAKQLDKAEYLDRAERTIRSSSAIMRAAPKAAPRMTAALAEYLQLRPAAATEEKPDVKEEKETE